MKPLVMTSPQASSTALLALISDVLKTSNIETDQLAVLQIRSAVSSPDVTHSQLQTVCAASLRVKEGR